MAKSFKSTEPDMDTSEGPHSLVPGNVRVHDRRTSIRLEREMWDALQEVAAMEDISVHRLCSVIHDTRRRGMTFSSAVRVYLLKFYRDKVAGTADEF